MSSKKLLIISLSGIFFTIASIDSEKLIVRIVHKHASLFFIPAFFDLVGVF